MRAWAGQKAKVGIMRARSYGAGGGRGASGGRFIGGGRRGAQVCQMATLPSSPLLSQRVRACMLSLSTTPTAKLFLGGLLNDSTVGRGMNMGGLSAKVNFVVVVVGGGVSG